MRNNNELKPISTRQLPKKFHMEKEERVTLTAANTTPKATIETETPPQDGS